MSVSVHIDRLVLEGVDLTPAELHRFQGQLERRLTLELAGAPAEGGPWASEAVAQRQAPAISAPAPGWAEAAAQSLAQAIRPGGGPPRG